MKKLIITVLMMGFMSQGAFGSSGNEAGEKKQTDKRETRERTKTQDELAYIKSNSG